MALQVGDTLGHYQLRRLVGTGGMAVVYEALDTTRQQLVALKLLLDDVARDSAMRRRFLEREVPIALQLDHPQIIAVTAAGDLHGYLYLAMELIAGGSLHDWLEQYPIATRPLAAGIDLMRQAAEGLAYAHDRGVIHRDVKPLNLLIDTANASPILKVCDFGLATILDSSLRTTRIVLEGSFDYMAPEQIQGLPVDMRVDTYALGAILYEVTTGVTPFQIATRASAAYKILHTAPRSPRELNPAISPALECLILRCLSKEPQRRPTCAALAAALRAIGEGRAIDPDLLRDPPAALEPQGHLALTCTEPQLTLTPGRAATITLTVTNLGNLVDHVVITIRGIRAAWLSPASHTVQLLPGQAQAVTFTALIPEEPLSLAGPYEVIFSAASEQVDPSVDVTIRATWQVAPFQRALLKATPQECHSTGTGRFTLTLSNQGNDWENFTITPRDLRQALRYELHSDPPEMLVGRQVRLRPGAAARLQLTARAQRRLIGSGPVPHSLTVEAAGATVTSTQMHLIQSPIIPAWMLSLLLPLLLLTCGGGGWMAYTAQVTIPATATAGAVTATQGAAREAQHATATAGASQATQTAEAVATIAAAQGAATQRAAQATNQAQGTITAATGVAGATATAERSAAAQNATAQAAALTATTTWLAADDDRDRLTNAEELELQTNPAVPDTDGDGLADFVEAREAQTDPLNPDMDADGLKDGIERERGTDPRRLDTDGDGIPDPQDAAPIATSTPLPSATATATVTAPPTATSTVMPTATPTSTATSSVTPTLTATPIPTATPTRTSVVSTVNLANLAQQGRWISGELLADGHNAKNNEILPWNGDPGDPRGFVILSDIELENGAVVRALRTHPRWVANGTIKGFLPWIRIDGKVRFEAEIGFVAGATKTDGVTFWVWEHHIEGGREVWNPIAQITKPYTGQLTPIQIDLSHLAGQDIQIELRVDAGASSGQDWAAWVNPRIVMDQ